MSTHQLSKLITHAHQSPQSVVLGQRSKQVLDNIAATGGMLEQLRDDLLLVRRRQGRGREDGSQFLVLLEDGRERVERFAGLV